MKAKGHFSTSRLLRPSPSCIFFVIVVISVSCIVTQQVKAQSSDMKCFNCTTQGEDMTCLNNPGRILNGETTCPNGWCTIVREEYTEVPGSIVTFARACSRRQPLFLNDVISNAHLTVYYTTCRSNTCNSGDGLRPNTGGGTGIGGGSGSSGYIIVHGEVSGSRMNQAHYYLLAVTCAITATATTAYARYIF